MTKEADGFQKDLESETEKLSQRLLSLSLRNQGTLVSVSLSRSPSCSFCKSAVPTYPWQGKKKKKANSQLSSALREAMAEINKHLYLSIINPQREEIWLAQLGSCAHLWSNQLWLWNKNKAAKAYHKRFCSHRKGAVAWADSSKRISNNLSGQYHLYRIPSALY